MIDESDHAPTRGAQDVYGTLRDHLDAQRMKLARLVDTDVPSFGHLVQSLAIPPIVP